MQFPAASDDGMVKVQALLAMKPSDAHAPPERYCGNVSYGRKDEGGADGRWKTCASVTDHEPHVRPRSGRAGGGALAGR